MSDFWKKIFMYVGVGHTYSNLSRLFLRVFTGVMFLQLGIRQVIHFDYLAGAAGDTLLSVIVVLELLCAVLIMLGLLTRLALIPSIAIMCYAETLVSPASGAGQLFNFEPGYPVMFLGIFVFMLLAGPGKISLDYLIAVHLNRNRDEDEILEQA